ncbi:hypothetical protein EVAR_24205_1 [Eumeta japonica]|uniref:Uncharacterized protein n=1 Tax=Eumeta variegata TaxID=151549 RepID=A0A4C1W643_EUMVA|nr:hypothetical protein EVAR_24205_1 [Eumeta japonica]
MSYSGSVVDFLVLDFIPLRNFEPSFFITHRMCVKRLDKWYIKTRSELRSDATARRASAEVQGGSRSNAPLLPHPPPAHGPPLTSRAHAGVVCLFIEKLSQP